MSEESPGQEKMADRVVEAILRRLDGDPLPALESLDRQSEATLREFTELVGLLPYELAPTAPSAETRGRLIAALADVTRGAPVAARSVPDRPPARSRRWALPVAAGLALGLLGVSVWQSARLGERRATIERLAERLSQADREAAELAGFRRQLQAARSNLSLVTSKGVEVCSLYPPGAEAAAEVPRGTLFVTADQRQWYLRIEGLEPCPEGRAYQLWFHFADGTAASGGLLEIESGAGLEVTSESMPAGTIAVSITLEPAGGSSQPSGQPVLYGDEVMRIL